MHCNPPKIEGKAAPADDQREALYNDRRVGAAWDIQVPREAVTRLHGLVVDLDSNLLRPNPWFPPGESADAFYAGIARLLDCHPILRHAEIRNTGRWLHAIVRFTHPVELHTANDQDTWTRLHKVLMASVPSDPAANALICLTRPIGATNSKTGARVTTLKQGTPIDAAIFEKWAKLLGERPFETIGLILFGDKRIAPCPYCNASGSHLDLGDAVGFCYGGACVKVPLGKLFEPFIIASAKPAKKTAKKACKKAEEVSIETAGTRVIASNGEYVVEINPDKVTSVTIRLRRDCGGAVAEGD